MTACEECGMDHSMEIDERFKDIVQRTLDLALETTGAMVDVGKEDGVSMAELAALCSAWENAMVAVFAMNTCMQVGMGETQFPEVEVDRDWTRRYLRRLADGIHDKLVFYAGDVLADNGYDHLDPRFNDDPNAKVRAEILRDADGS